jgi:hypothetical protein
MGLSRLAILPVTDPTNQGSGAPNIRVLGAIRPHSRGQPKSSKVEMVARVSQIYVGKARIKKCPKAYSLSRPADLVSPQTYQVVLLCFLIYIV